MSKPFTPSHYHLRSFSTGNLYEDTGWMLDPPGETTPSLLRAIYPKRQIDLLGHDFGLYTFADWLPINRILKGSAAPVTYKSEKLAGELGLKNLYITFSGYWPERGAMMKSCSFKETEAFSVCGRLIESPGKVLVVASAGNTARSFARVCSANDIPLLLCMPEDTLDAMWFEEPLRDCVKLAVTCSGSDYFDAIHLSNLACKVPGFFPEGGARNVARRDGMATTVLSAVTFIGQIPGYYFQAVGSGTGAIAAWEANLRLIDDGRFGSRKMKLIVSQNTPFLPMYEAWKAGSRDLFPLDDEVAREHVREICAKVLSNRRPPYSVAGGLFDALSDSGGTILKVSNEEAAVASERFENSEGRSIHPAAAVATGSLFKAVKEGLVDPEAVIMLNITGGGEVELKKEKSLYSLQPSVKFDVNSSQEDVTQKLSNLF